MTLVKICGLTREADVEAALQAGAAAVGVVVWPKSPRAVTVARARALMAVVPVGVARVGVFVGATLEQVRAAVETVGFDVVQLHGDESWAMVTELASSSLVLRAVPDRHTLDGWTELPLHTRSRVAWLVDAHDPERRGGTGVRADWQYAARLAREHPTVLAGGLHAGNVREALRVVRPAALDVSSGVESSPGVKDESRIKALFSMLGSSDHVPIPELSTRPGAFVRALFESGVRSIRI